MIYTQDGRSIAINTPLGKDRLLLAGLRGEEHLSKAFRFDLDLLSEDHEIAPADLIGKRVAIRIRDAHDGVRWINGMVSEFAAGWLTQGGLRQYKAVVVPWLWFLGQHTDCRIFQFQTVLDIVNTVFGEFGFSGDYDITHVKDAHPEWEYATQYQESTFTFITRLLEHEGIFWYFRHSEDRHMLCLADQNQGFVDGAVPEVDVDASGSKLGWVTDWYHRYRFHPGHFSTSDYDYLNPSTPLLSNRTLVMPVPLMDKYERYEWPGDYFTNEDGELLVRYRMEEAEASYHHVEGASTCPSFTPGTRITLKTHPDKKEVGKAYALLSVRHQAEERSYLARDAGPSFYRNSFEAFPLVSTVTGGPIMYRPPRVTPTPQIAGYQTAVVVAPSGHDPKVAYEDGQARVKVQFHWDRHGAKNDTSSCWLRVMSPWAGKNYGDVKLPLPGSEVVIAFQEGDPDRPVIIGCLYNGDNRTPTWERSAGENTTSNTIDQGGNSIRTESKEGQESVALSSPQASAQIHIGKLNAAPTVPPLPLNFPGTAGGAVSSGSTSDSSSGDTGSSGTESTQAAARQPGGRPHRRKLGEVLARFGSTQAGAGPDGTSSQQQMTTSSTYTSYDSTKNEESAQEAEDAIEDSGAVFYCYGPSIDYSEYKLTYVNGDSISVIIGDTYKYVDGNDWSYQKGSKYSEVAGHQASISWGAKASADFGLSASWLLGLSYRVTTALQVVAEGPAKMTAVVGSEVKIIGGPTAAALAASSLYLMPVAVNPIVMAEIALATAGLAYFAASSTEFKFYPTALVAEAGFMKAGSIISKNEVVGKDFKGAGMLNGLYGAIEKAAVGVVEATAADSKVKGSELGARGAELESAATDMKTKVAKMNFSGINGLF